MWVKLDDDFPDHPKLTALGADECWLHVCGICYCNRYLTDGFIPDGVIERLARIPDPQASMLSLVEAGLWHLCDKGCTVHDYLKYQPSREEMEAKRLDLHDKRVLAGSKGGLATKRRARSDPANGVAKAASAKQTGSPVPVPVPKEKEQYGQEFEKFWNAYPERKGGKHDASLKYAKRLEQGATDASLFLAALNYAKDRAADNDRPNASRYTKHASAFLFQRNDEDYQTAPEVADDDLAAAWSKWIR
jgi:hypothetical protein